uniref:RING-type domain-containing protein n=1 Tax=Meloidogyne javanica TaxID=6303 RepID=A0A915LC92_MELJA
MEEFAQKSQNVLAFYFNKSCHSAHDSITKNLKTETFNKLSAVSPAEEFFENYVLEKTLKLDQFGGINLKVALALAIAWTLTGLVLVKGVKMMGKISYFTATIPYVIIVILFIRGITLDGASIGLDYYIFHPDFSTWRAAATQVCYSLSVGFGGILSLSSYNPRTHNCYRDAFIITMADGFMSIFGGTAVFSVLGFMSKQLNAKIQTVVQSGTGLAFIAYPEAMSRMPLPWLWSFLFFLMLFILGISSQFGLAEVMITAIYDQFPAVRPYRGWLAVGVCGSLFLVGLIMCTRLRLPNFFDDLRSMFGYPRTWLGRIFGPTGYYIQGIWCFLAPLQITILFIVVLFTQISHNLTYGKDKRLYEYPNWAIGLGWFWFRWNEKSSSSSSEERHGWGHHRWGPFGRGRRGGFHGSRGVGSGVAGGVAVASSSRDVRPSSSTNELQELIRDYSSYSFADHISNNDCLDKMEKLSQEGSSNIPKKYLKFLEKSLSEKGVSNSQIKKKMNEMINDGSAVNEIKEYCDNFTSKSINEIKQNCSNKMKEFAYNEVIQNGIEECPICTEEFTKDKVIAKTKCGHYFHWDCISKNFAEGSGNYESCPICRKELEFIANKEVEALNNKLKIAGIGFEGRAVDRQVFNRNEILLLI